MSKTHTIYNKIASSPFLVPALAFLVTFSIGFYILRNTSPEFLSPQNVTSDTKVISFINKYSQNESIEVEIADSAQEWADGLMSRTALEPNRGMLFVFDTVEPRTFWMKDTLIPLDIIFLDENLKVVKIYKETKADQTSETYPSEVNIKYALETNAGWSDTVGLEVGNEIFLR